MILNEAGISLIKSFEDCRLKAYKDIVGVWTIGWGHTGEDVVEGLEIDQAEADSLFKDDVARCVRGVAKILATPSLTDNQFSALVSFVFNLGLGSLRHSTLLIKINAGSLDGAADEFLRWNHARGVPVAGLTRRREAERALFLS